MTFRLSQITTRSIASGVQCFLRRRRGQETGLQLQKKYVDNVNWPPYRDWKADVSSVSPSSEQMDLLWRRANARNVSFSISVRWSIYIINSVDKPNFRVSLPHRRSTTVSSETNPLYRKNMFGRPAKEALNTDRSDKEGESLTIYCCGFRFC